MGYILKNLPADNSTFANYSNWASNIGSSFALAGWVQSNDTGQAVWTASVVSITNASGNGSLATYTYSLTSGPALRQGMSITITGCTTAGFNGTFTINGLPTGSTFTVTNTTNTTEAETATGTVATTPTAVPASANSYPAYEIWHTADTLSATLPIYVKLEYGCNAATVGPATAFTIGTGSSGSGQILNTPGRVATTVTWGLTSTTSAGQLWECDFAWYNAAGGGNGIAIMMYRNLLQNGLSGNYSNGLPWLLVIERSHDANGNDTAEYFTWISQFYGFNGFQCFIADVGGAPGQIYRSVALGQLFPSPGNDASSNSMGGSCYLSPVMPMVGKIGNPMRLFALGKIADFQDGSTPQMPLYGTTQTFLMGRQEYGGNWMNYGSYNNTFPNVSGIRWDSGA